MEEKRYGIWNSLAKEFQLGISEPSKTKAMKALYAKIGKGAYKWRFQPRGIK